MSGNFSQEDVLDKFFKLSPSFEALDRDLYKDPDEIVSSLKSTVFSSLNSDIDSVYSLVREFSLVQASACVAAISLLEEIQALTLASRAEPRSGDVSLLSDVAELLDDMDGAGDSYKDAKLEQLKSKIQQLLSTNTGDSGSAFAGISPQKASVKVEAKVDLVRNLVSYLRLGLSGFIELITNYSGTDTVGSGFSAQLSSAKSAVASFSEGAESDLSEAILELAVAHSLLSQKRVKRDITEPKFEGPVETLPGSSAFLVGDTVPLILQDNAAANITVDGAHAVQITAPMSDEAFLDIPVPGSLLERKDAGVLISVDGVVSEISSDGVYGSQTLRLKEYVKPESLVLNAYVENSAGDVNITTFSDNGYGYILGPLYTSPQQFITPDTVAPTADDLYHFTGDQALGPLSSANAPAQAEINVFDNNNVQVTQLLDQGDGTLLSSNGCSGTVIYDSGELHLNLSALGPLPAGSTFEMKRWKVYTSGEVNYDTGAYNLRLPLLDPNLKFHSGSDISASYDYYPLGKLLALNTPNKNFNRVGAYAGNSAVDDAVGTFTAYVPGTSGTANPPIRTAAELFTHLSGNAATYNTKGLVVSAIPNGNLRLATTVRGSNARVAPFSLRPAGINKTPFGDTWAQPPETLIQALGVLYSNTGERFGADTSLPSVQVSGASEVIDFGAEAGQTLIFSGMGTVLSPTTVQVSADTKSSLEVSGVSPGDTVRITSPFKINLKFLSLDGTTMTLGSGEIPLGIPGANSFVDVVNVLPLISGQALKFSITSNNLMVTSKSQEPTSSVEVVSAGLGFSGSSKGYSSKVTLKNLDLSPVVERAGYTIKPNDVVVINDLRVAKVVSVTYPVVSIEILPGKSEGSDYTYPFTSLRVEALGYRSWREKYPVAYALEKRITDFITSNDTLYTDIKVYSYSGTGFEHYQVSVNFLVAALSDLLTLYTGYEAHNVKSVDSLLNFLKDEKMSLVLSYLLSLDFSAVSRMSSAGLATEGSVEGFLESITSALSGGGELIQEIYDGESSILHDYSQRETIGGDDLIDDITVFDLE